MGPLVTYAVPRQLSHGPTTSFLILQHILLRRLHRPWAFFRRASAEMSSGRSTPRSKKMSAGKYSVTDIGSSMSSSVGIEHRPAWDATTKYNPPKITNRALKPEAVREKFNAESPDKQAAEEARRAERLRARRERLEQQRTLFIEASEGSVAAKREVAQSLHQAERQQLAELAATRSADAEAEFHLKASFNAEHAAHEARDAFRSDGRRSAAREVGDANRLLMAEVAERRRSERQQRIAEELALLSVSDGRPGSAATHRARYR